MIYSPIKEGWDIREHNNLVTGVKYFESTQKDKLNRGIYMV